MTVRERSSYLTLSQAATQGSALLAESQIPVPKLTAEVLLCHALHQERAYLFAHPERPLTELEWIHYGRYLHQRLEGMPTQYITGTQEFYGRPFRVTPDVLIPRPETEHLVEAALLHSHGTVIDVGCGSGAIAVTLSLESKAQIVTTDISERALRVAQANAKALNASVTFLLCDLLSAIASESADLVVSNPPYIRDAEHLQREVAEWEPRHALFAGPDGLEIYRRLIPEAHRVLKPEGYLALELGYDSLTGVTALLEDGWATPVTIPDYAGIPRVLVCQKRQTLLRDLEEV